ncbi:hypothetical protein [Xanthocytophaga agilis]|uniref:Uncharacterized protein n=1 Tax=Xanthocytophaga agilis TaxID=3048010 RepID=A0AAE3R295_9BACT|nr:hypothetical protein [Xanthocytophaga agilis]MDJ1499342.1 hypothetical protein [Xanthocytophaga agilis]
MTSKQYFLTQSIIHLALMMGQILFAIVTFYIGQTSPLPGNEELKQTFTYLIPLVALTCLAAAFLLFTILLKKAKEKASLSQKISAYGTAMIVRYALLEAPSLLSIIAFFLTGNYTFLSVFGLVIILFIFLRPSKDKLIQELELDSNEEMLINTPDAIIMKRYNANHD